MAKLGLAPHDPHPNPPHKGEGAPPSSPSPVWEGLGWASRARSIGGLRGWRRVLLALALGVAGALAMPPFNLVPLLAVALTGLVWLLDGAGTARRGFSNGWLWGMGFFVPSLHWIAISLFVDIGQFWWMVPFAVLGLPAYLALYTGAATWAVQRTTDPATLGRLVAFPAWWVVGEWLRGHLLTGFPWLLAGYAWSADARPLLAIAQSASVLGIYGVSLVTVAAATLPAALTLPRGRWLVVGTGLASFSLLWFWGMVRLSQGPDALVPNLKLRIVSTDLPHRANWDPDGEAADFRSLLALARQPGLDQVALAVWPEGVVEAPLNRDRRTRDAVATAIPPAGLVLTGTIRVEGQGASLKAWNSVLAETASGEIAGYYDKHHLVPFGEYVPFHDLLSFSQIAAARFDFSTGPGPATIHLPGLPAVGPVICYEAIFPGDVVDEADPPGWILNVTDDGWFGRSIGPAQHFAIARIRAIEEGLPLVRSANGGISGVIDPHGRVLASLPPGAPGVLDVPLPLPLATRPFYVYWGNSPLVFFILLAISMSTIRRESGRRFWQRWRR